MDRKRLLKHLVFLMFFLFLANTVAIKLNWYSLIWYFDIIMHILSGLWVGMFFLYVFERKESRPLDVAMFLKVFFATLAIGLLWEVYEFYLYQYLSQIPFDSVDTVADLFNDVLGSSIAFFYFSKFIMLSSQNKLKYYND